MHVTFNRAIVAAAAVLLTTTAAAAQDMKATFQSDFERQRANVLAYAGAMPEEGLRTAPTEGVRDFAQQIEHIVAGAVNIISSGIDSSRNELGDPEVYLNSTAALLDFVNAGYDEIAAMLEGMSAESLREEGMLFGQMPKAKWQIIRTAHEHGVWTLGATVPYLRLQGATPPGYNVITG